MSRLREYICDFIYVNLPFEMNLSGTSIIFLSKYFYVSLYHYIVRNTEPLITFFSLLSCQSVYDFVYAFYVFPENWFATYEKAAAFDRSFNTETFVRFIYILLYWNFYDFYNQDNLYIFEDKRNCLLIYFVTF